MSLRPVPWLADWRESTANFDDNILTSDRERYSRNRALAEAAETWFSEQGLKNSELHVLFNNEAARQMWEELGYEPLALGMRKKL